MMKEKILSGKTYLGIELGSTRIKACLIDENGSPVLGGSFEWENAYENGYWTYSLDIIHKGVKECFADLCKNVKDTYGTELTKIGAVGVSAMMHGYLAFDKDFNLLVPFRTWRNTTTAEASEILTKEFGFNIPQRWSISHLYQAILNGEEHIKDVAYITTLAGYIHYLLTGKHEVGIGDASGIFPVCGGTYDKVMMEKFDKLAEKHGFKQKLSDILPTVKTAGEEGSYLTKEGAAFLDASGKLESGIPVCPPEGDAGTGMVATNAVQPKTGNISAGTSIFSMLVLEKPLSDIYSQIDIVTTPDGHPVAMVHCNNCAGELDTWVNIFGEALGLFGLKADKSMLYEKLYTDALSGCTDGIISYNYLSGEHVTNVKSGKPMYYRMPGVKMNLSSFMKSLLSSSMATLAGGMEVLFDKEKVCAESFTAHGGLFKVKGAAQQILANALNTPISVMETAGEGGAWGMALLACYMINKDSLTLGEWLKDKIFGSLEISTLAPEAEGVKEYKKFLESFKAGLSAQHALSEVE